MRPRGAQLDFRRYHVAMAKQEQQPRRGVVIETFEGDADSAYSRLIGFKRDSAVISHGYDELLEMWPDHFVACKDGTIFTDPDMDGLFRQLRDAGIDPRDAAIWFLRTGNYCFSPR